MSLPAFSTQGELFSTAGLSASLFAPTDRYRLFAQLVYPKLASARAALEKCYCADNGRVAIEPVLMLGVSLLQELDGVPDRLAIEMLRYHAGWNFGLNRQLGDSIFHPTSLVNFRHRLEEHQQSALVFKTVLDALVEAKLVSRQSRQRLDSTRMFGRVARMNRVDCVRESLRLALQELEGVTPAEERPVFWRALWERYVESQVDYRASAETLGRKLGEAGGDAWQLLEWLRQPAQRERAAGTQAQLLKRVFGEQSDEVGALQVEQEQAAMGWAKPPVQYVDGAYVSAQKLAEAQAEGRELMGPAQPAPRKDGRFSVEDFQIDVEQRTALCPAGKLNTQCSRLVEEATGKVDYRFEFSTQCHDCPLRERCLGKDQRHRTLVVGEHHTVLQARRQEQQTQAFKQRMKHRNGIEGTQSELVRGHGLRRARYRGLAKVKLQNYFIGAACNVKRWLRREAWLLQQAAAAAG